MLAVKCNVIKCIFVWRPVCPFVCAVFVFVVFAKVECNQVHWSPSACLSICHNRRLVCRLIIHSRGIITPSQLYAEHFLEIFLKSLFCPTLHQSQQNTLLLIYTAHSHVCLKLCNCLINAQECVLSQ